MRFGPGFVPVLFVASWLGCLGWLEASTLCGADPPATVRIGQWNIQWLGQPEKRPSNAPAQQASDLARYLLQARVDLVAIEEIGDTDGDPAKRTNRTLDEVVAILSRDTRSAWRYLLFAKKEGLAPEDQVGQLTGVLWNTSRATLVGEPYRIELDVADHEFDLWQRHPHAAKFSLGEGKTDLVVIPLHMKSNRGGQGKTAKQRWIEAKRLAASLDKIREKLADRDLVLAGDLNVLKPDERALSVFRAAGFRDLNDQHVATVTGGDAPFDRILVPRDQPEFSECRLTVVDPDDLDHGQFFRSLSDHYLVATEIAVRADDD